MLGSPTPLRATVYTMSARQIHFASDILRLGLLTVHQISRWSQECKLRFIEMLRFHLG